MKVTKSVKDPKKTVAEISKKTEQRREMGRRIERSEPPAKFIQTWDEHVKKRTLISNFTTIFDNKMFNFQPKENEVLIPFSEYNGDHSMNWIICWHELLKKEIYRKNIRTVDLIEWVVE